MDVSSAIPEFTLFSEKEKLMEDKFSFPEVTEKANWEEREERSMLQSAVAENANIVTDLVSKLAPV